MKGRGNIQKHQSVCKTLPPQILTAADRRIAFFRRESNQRSGLQNESPFLFLPGNAERRNIKTCEIWIF